MKFNLEYAKPTPRPKSRLGTTLIIGILALGLLAVYLVMQGDAEALRTGLIH